jgi:hypothetical protein
MIRTLFRRHPLLRFLALNLVLGLVVGAFAIGGLIGLDVLGLRRLILADQSPVLALVLLAGGFMVTFASTVMGTAIMALGRRIDGDGGAPAAEPAARMAAVVVNERRR